MIRYVDVSQIKKVIDKEDKRRDSFIAKENDHFIAVDNTTGNAFTEKFKTIWGAIRYCVIKNLTAEQVRRDEIVHRAFERETRLML
jgi:hypothetical protein